MRNLFLINPNVGGSIESTTTYDGNRTRQTSGIFLSQIHINNTALNANGLCSFIDFVVRATPRNKAIFSTNKGGYSYVAVEPLSHPIVIKGDISLLTKHTRKPTMNIKTQQGDTAQNLSIAFTAHFLGGYYA